MRLIRFALPTTFLLLSLAWGGQIDGTLYQSGQPVAGQNIQVRCEPNVLQSGTTDSRGAFSIYMDQTGICAFEVIDLGVTHKIYSYRDPVRYDFDLVVQPDGRYLLRRR
jgi:hypothetical protein